MANSGHSRIVKPATHSANANDADPVQPLAEHEPAEHRGPDRHRIGDDDGARGRAAELREAGEDLKRRDVEKAGHHHMQVFAARHPQLVPGEDGGGEQGRGADAGAGKAQAPGRHLAQRHRRGDPVEAPGEGQQHDQQLGRGGNVALGIRMRHCAVGSRAGKRRASYRERARLARYPCDAKLWPTGSRKRDGAGASARHVAPPSALC